MAYIAFTLKTLPDTIDEVVFALAQQGFDEVVIEDQEAFSGFLEENKAYWDYIDEALQEKLDGLSQITLYLEETDTAGRARLESVVEKLRAKEIYGKLPLTAETLPETDWQESWKENYPPQNVGKDLVVLPYWLENPTARKPIILDPGLTFGTGAHPSTQMVLSFMEQHIRPGCSCLDLGSGSGILSIAALRLGAKSAIGVDIDPKAEDIARQNCGYNGFAAPEFTAYTGNVVTDKPLMDSLTRPDGYDVVLVNIVADVIIHLAPVLPRFMGKDSRLICSGILDTRLAEVIAALRDAGLEILDTCAQEDWRSLLAKRRDL